MDTASKDRGKRGSAVRSAGKLVLFLALCLGVGVLGGLATAQSVETWYRDLRKPVWTPADQVFGPVWITLYVMMAVSIWLLWKKRSEHNYRLMFSLFSAQLLLNLVWSFLFFGLRRPDWAFYDIAALWILLLNYLILSRPVSRDAWALFVPYFLWVSFAAVLNFAIWRMNPIA